MFICPLAATGGAKEEKSGTVKITKADSQDGGESILVLSSSTKKINEIDMFEYVVGAVAAEMPPVRWSSFAEASAPAARRYA